MGCWATNDDALKCKCFSIQTTNSMNEWSDDDEDAQLFLLNDADSTSKIILNQYEN